MRLFTSPQSPPRTGSMRLRVSAQQAPIVREELSGRVRLKFTEHGWFSSRTFVITGPHQSIDDAHRAIFNKLFAQMQDARTATRR